VLPKHITIDLYMGIKKATESFTVAFITLSLISFLMFYLYGKEFILNIYFICTYLALMMFIMLKAYSTNKKYIITDKFLHIPASDVENNLFEVIILKQVFGLFYRKKINLLNIQQVYLDYSGNQFPIIIIDNIASNKVVFSSKQKRDEFYHRLTYILRVDRCMPF